MNKKLNNAGQAGTTAEQQTKDEVLTSSPAIANAMLAAVALSSRWHEILGSKPSDIPYDVRRQRWEEWKRLGMNAGKRGKKMVNYWSKDYVDETCYGCKWRDGDWCKHSELPCNVNPVLTINGPGIIGMACCGLGYETKQLDMFECVQP